MRLTLYYRKQCPFCKKVLTALNEMKRTVPMKDLAEHPKYPEELTMIGGKTQVPCLVQTDDKGNATALYESDAIILWFQENQ